MAYGKCGRQQAGVLGPTYNPDQLKGWDPYTLSTHRHINAILHPKPLFQALYSCACLLDTCNAVKSNPTLDTHPIACASLPTPTACVLTSGLPSLLKQWCRAPMYAFSWLVLNTCVRQMAMQ
jgi:hypothetical protein